MARTQATNGKKAATPSGAGPSGPPLKGLPVSDRVPLKGLTKHGTPRVRGIRTYYGLTGAGELIRFDDYNARELAIKDGHVRRVSAHEAREIESRGTLAQPLSTRLPSAPGGLGVIPSGVTPRPLPVGTISTGEPVAPYEAGPRDRTLLEVYMLLERVATDLGRMQSLLQGLVR